MQSITKKETKKVQNNYIIIVQLLSSSAFLQLFFSSNFVVFVEGGARIFLGAGHPRYLYIIFMENEYILTFSHLCFV